MSSCQRKSDSEVVPEELKKERELEIYNLSKSFLNEVVMNMCALEGMSGHIDAALGIDRSTIIAKVLQDVAKELEE